MTREIVGKTHKAERQKWRTDPALAARVVQVFGIDLDAMATRHDTIVPRFICDPADPASTWPINEAVAIDALDPLVRWQDHGRAIFVNPPFEMLSRGRLIEQIGSAVEGGALVVMLAPDNGDTRWYSRLVDWGAHVWRFRGRPRYVPAIEQIEDRAGAAFPSALYVLRPPLWARSRGASIPTFAVDPKTLAFL